MLIKHVPIRSNKLNSVGCVYYIPYHIGGRDALVNRLYNLDFSRPNSDRKTKLEIAACLSPSPSHALSLAEPTLLALRLQRRNRV